MQIWIDHVDVVSELEDLGIDTAPWIDNSYAKMDKEVLKAQREFERLTRRKFEQDTITEKMNGSGKESLVLRYFPVVSIASIKITDVPGWPYTLTLAQYRVDVETGVVVLVKTEPLLVARFSPGNLNVEATYTYGYLVADIPQDIKDCIIYMSLIGIIMRTPADWEKLGLKGVRIAQYAEQYGYVSGTKGKTSIVSGIYGPQKQVWQEKIESTIARYKRIPVV